jgi:glycine betaine catabolism A
MHTQSQHELIDRLLREVETPSPCTRADAYVSVAAYTSQEHAAAELAIFRRSPLAIAHASELPEPGDFVTRDVAGVPVLLVRDGTISAFVNACRHRGTRLVDAPSGHVGKAFVCRYHAWTYDRAGALVHLPHADTFPSLDCASMGLAKLPVEVRHGFVWVSLTGNASLDVRGHLGEAIDGDLDAFGLATHTVHRRVCEPRRCNWKLVIEAFLEGYHARFLHQRTIARFFIDRGVVVDRFGSHVRSAGARKELLALRDAPRETWRVRDAATLFYFVFPNTIFVLHPDWISHVVMTPIDTSRSIYAHSMLVPRETGEDRKAHWDATWSLIEERVFQTEDLSVAESIQSTLGSGSESQFRIGGLELPIRWFHDALQGA